MWALAGYGARLLIQAVYFVVIARCLGPGQYGGFVAATALASVLAPFVGLGCGSLMVRAVAKDKTSFSECWGNGLFATVITSLPIAALVLAVCRFILPHQIPTFALLCIVLADLFFVKLLDMTVWAYQAHEWLSRYAQLNTLISISRLLGIVGVAVMVKHPGIKLWSSVYLAAAAVSAAIALVTATLSLGRPSLALSRLWMEAGEGIHFSMSTAAQTVYNDIDKSMMARLSTLEATGIYGAAYRLIDVAFIPVRAVLNAAYPGFFRAGVDGFRQSLRYGCSLQRRVLPYSFIAVVALFLGAPLVPHALGPRYANVTEALRWLSPIPILKTFQFFVADSLTGAGHQPLRSFAQIAVALFNVLINLWIIPTYGWRGAAWSSLASDGLLALVLWGTAGWLLLREKSCSGLQPSEGII